MEGFVGTAMDAAISVIIIHHAVRANADRASADRLDHTAQRAVHELTAGAANVQLVNHHRIDHLRGTTVRVVNSILRQYRTWLTNVGAWALMGFKAVLWDFGGVITSSPFDAFNRYEAERGIPQDFIRGVNATNPDDNAWAKFESSRIDADEFDSLFLAETTAAGHPIPGRDVTQLLGGDVRPNMVSVLKRCKQSYTVACLTNNADAGQGSGMSSNDRQAGEVASVMALFDCVVESSKEGMRKPQPGIYELACERIGVSPSDVVYLDDLGINLKPARAMGMTTIKVLSEAQAIDDLGQVLAIDFEV